MSSSFLNSIGTFMTLQHACSRKFTLTRYNCRYLLCKYITEPIVRRGLFYYKIPESGIDMSKICVFNNLKLSGFKTTVNTSNKFNFNFP